MFPSSGSYVDHEEGQVMKNNDDEQKLTYENTVVSLRAILTLPGNNVSSPNPPHSLF